MRTAAPDVLAGRYLRLDLLGVGGMGSVWRAFDLREHRYVAVKLLSRYERPHLARFVREQAVRIDHPHVAAPTGWFGEVSGGVEVVGFSLELVRGGSVADLLAEHGALPPAFALRLLDQLLRGLAAVHAAGLVHRDLKPANLLLEPTGRGRPHLRIGDFGVAAPLDGTGATAVRGVVGTDLYAAPEQLRGAAPDVRQDLYSVGVVAARLLGDDGPWTPVVAALTDADPERRPPSADAARRLLAEACQEVAFDGGAPPAVPDRLGAAPVRAPRVEPAEPEPEEHRGVAWLVLGLAGALLVAALLVLVG
jgi:serine/threonine-protein kinase